MRSREFQDKLQGALACCATTLFLISRVVSSFCLFFKLPSKNHAKEKPLPLSTYHSDQVSCREKLWIVAALCPLVRARACVTAVISILGQKDLQDNRLKSSLLCNSVRRFISVLTLICRFAAKMGFIRPVTVTLSVLIAGKGLFMMLSRDIVYLSCEFTYKILGGQLWRLHIQL